MEGWCACSRLRALKPMYTVSGSICVLHEDLKWDAALGKVRCATVRCKLCRACRGYGFRNLISRPISPEKIQGDPHMMVSCVPQYVSSWPIDSRLVTIVGLPPKDPPDDDDENEQDEENDEEDNEDEEPAVVGPDEC